MFSDFALPGMPWFFLIHAIWRICSRRCLWHWQLRWSWARRFTRRYLADIRQEMQNMMFMLTVLLLLLLILTYINYPFFDYLIIFVLLVRIVYIVLYTFFFNGLYIYIVLFWKERGISKTPCHLALIKRGHSQAASGPLYWHIPPLCYHLYWDLGMHGSVLQG